MHPRSNICMCTYRLYMHIHMHILYKYLYILYISTSLYFKNQQFTLIFPIPVQHHKFILIFSLSIFVSPLSSTKNIFTNLITSSECNPSSVTRVAPHPPCKHSLGPDLGSDLHVLDSKHPFRPPPLTGMLFSALSVSDNPH